MHNYDYDGSPLGRFLRAVTRSFAIGTFFGVHVRMYWAAAVLMPLLFLTWTSPGAGTTTEALVLAAILFVCLFVVVYTHEMGHIAAGWHYGIRSDLITLSPLGGLAHMNAPARTPREEAVITLAGPAVHLVWLAVVWPLWAVLPDRVLDLDGWAWCPIAFAVWFLKTTNLSLLLFNLLPIFPLDGGRVLRALLAHRVHANRATMWAANVGVVGGVAMCLLALWQPRISSSILFVIGISCISASLQEKRSARHVLVYQQHFRDPWEADGDAWKRGAGSHADAQRRPGWLARWRSERAARKAAAAAAAAAALDREVDAVLERVHQVGMSGLDDRERAILKRASQRHRSTG